jgi:prepilin-type N-terminal cleavage/methylation domain-containing protein
MLPILRSRNRGPPRPRCPGGQNDDASLTGKSDDEVCSCDVSSAPADGVPANEKREKTGGPTCGFSLAEVLVALAVAAMMAAILTPFVAGTRFNAAQVRERLELWTIAQSMLDGLGETLSPGTSSGQNGAYRWRREIAPITAEAVAQTEAFEDHLHPQGRQETAAPSTPWVLYRVKVQIEAPSGRQYAADTIRINRPQTVPVKDNGTQE